MGPMQMLGRAFLAERLSRTKVIMAKFSLTQVWSVYWVGGLRDEAGGM